MNKELIFEILLIIFAIIILNDFLDFSFDY